MSKVAHDNTLKRVHIISRDDKWAVKLEGTSRASKIYPNKTTAVNSTNTLLKNGHDIVVHRRDGSVQQWKKSIK